MEACNATVSGSADKCMGTTSCSADGVVAVAGAGCIGQNNMFACKQAQHAPVLCIPAGSSCIASQDGLSCLINKADCGNADVGTNNFKLYCEWGRASFCQASGRLLKLWLAAKVLCHGAGCILPDSE